MTSVIACRRPFFHFSGAFLAVPLLKWNTKKKQMLLSIPRIKFYPEMKVGKTFVIGAERFSKR